MTALGFFGYGSLVNLATHSYATPRPATLQGWRRIWRGTRLREVAYLSVEPADDCTLHGIVAEVGENDWSALDIREAAYLRHDVTTQVKHNGQPMRTAVYQVAPDHVAATGAHPILRSYLDVVVQGYLRAFGEAGVAAFFATTHGWDLPILDDRAAPIYPRHQPISATETDLVDAHLAAMVK